MEQPNELPIVPEWETQDTGSLAPEVKPIDPTMEAPVPDVEPVVPIQGVPPVELQVTASRPYNTFEKTLANLTSEEREYYRNNPEDLEAHLVFSRVEALRDELPDASEDELMTRAYSDLMYSRGTPLAETQIIPVDPETTVPERETGLFRGILNSVARVVPGTAAGVADFGIEVGSSVGRFFDWALEKSDVTKDWITDDSWVNTMKEGLSTETKEYITSLGGRFKTSDYAVLRLGENLGQITLGAYLLSIAGARAVATQVGQKLMTSAPVAATSGFLSNHQRIAKVSQWALDGAQIDVAATVVADPSTLAGLAPDTFSDFLQWYEKASPLEKRSANLAEGIFINLFLGAVGGIKQWLTGLDQKSIVEQSTKELELLTRKPQDVVNPWEYAQGQTVDDAVLSFRKELKDSGVTIDELLNYGHNVHQALSTEIPTILPKTTTRDILSEITETNVKQGPPVTDLFLTSIRETAPRAGVELPQGLLLKRNTSELLLGLKITAEEATEASEQLFLTEVKQEGTKKIIRTVKKTKATAKVEEAAKKLDVEPEVIIKAATDKAAKVLPVEQAAPVIKAAKESTTAPKVNVEIQKNTDFSVGKADSFNTIRLTPEDADILVKIRDVPQLTKKEAKRLQVDLDRALQVRAAFEEAKKLLKKDTTVVLGADLTPTVLADTVVVSRSSIESIRKAKPNKYPTEDAVVKRALDIVLGRRAFVDPTVYGEMLSKAASTGVDAGLYALKLAGKVMDFSGLLGGVSSTYLLQLDINGDDKVDLWDAGLGAMAFFIGGTLHQRATVTREAADKLGRDTLVKLLEQENQSILGTYLMAKEMITNSLPSLHPDDVVKYTSIVKKLEQYMFHSNENVVKLLDDPEVARRIAVANKGPLEFTQRAREDLAKSIRDNQDYFPAGDLIKVDRLHFISPATFEEEFSRIAAGVEQVFRANAGNLTPVHMRSTFDRLSAEIGMSQVAYDKWLSNSDPIGLASRIHVARGILSSIDKSLEDMAKLSLVDGKQAYDFMTLVNQRRGIVEYLRNGGVVGGDDMMKALALANKGATLSIFPKSILDNMWNTPRAIETTELALKMLRENGFKGARLTHFVDELGKNVTMGQAGLQALYVSLFSNPLTWGKAWLENSLSLGTAIVAEVGASALGVLRGNTTWDVLGKQGFLGGIMSNIGPALTHARDVISGKSLGIDASAVKEFADYRSITKMVETLGLQNPDMVTRGLNRMMKLIGIDPIAMTVAPDIFFKTLLFGGYEQKYVIEAAFDLASQGGTVDDVIRAVRSNSDTMTQIRESAMKRAREYTFTDDLSGVKSFTNTLVEARARHPLFRLIFPIFKTPLLATRHFMRHTPLAIGLVGQDRRTFWGWLSKVSSGTHISPAEQRAVNEIGGRVIAGITTAGAAWYMLDTMGFDIMGSGQFDPGMQAKATMGVRPHSIYNRKTGESVSMERLVHFKATLGLMADIRDLMEHKFQGVLTEDLAGVVEGAGYMMYSLFENSQPDQVEDLMRIMGATTNKDRLVGATGKVLDDTVARLYPSVFRAIGSEADPYRRATQSSVERTLAAVYAGLGEYNKMRPSLDIYGNLRTEKPGELRPDPLLLEAEAAGYNVRDYLNRRQNPGGAVPNDSIDEQNVAFEAERRHGAAVNRMRTQLVDQLRRLGGPEEKKKYLTDTFNRITRDVTKQLKNDPKFAPALRRMLDRGGRKQ